jgi:sugar (pentulose or hexulose) kinase
MKAIPVIAIFDVGKTNKKFFLFDEKYGIVLERTTQFPETTDEDGFACDDVQLLQNWVQQTLADIYALEKFDLKAVNFSAYGASFVYIDEQGNTVAPLYNYLKPYPQQLTERFYGQYGTELEVAIQTASPVLGNLNSGLQLYRIKYDKPDLYEKIGQALHLPQFLSYLVTRQPFSDITSIGCHTQLWNFAENKYHRWVTNEGIDKKLPPVFPSDDVVPFEFEGKRILAGVGLHDSSAALIPYLTCFTEPFILISTGTWCITLNPYNDKVLTREELEADCLCYMGYHGKPVKASRLFAGNEHEQQTRRLAKHFPVPVDQYKRVQFNPSLVERLQNAPAFNPQRPVGLQESIYGLRDLSSYTSYEEAYHQLIIDIVEEQKISTTRVMEGTPVKRIFVDGGFSHNSIYMHLLAAAFPQVEVFAASVAQATAVGAALSIHNHWNSQPVPGDMIELKFYTIPHTQEA